MSEPLQPLGPQDPMRPGLVFYQLMKQTGLTDKSGNVMYQLAGQSQDLGAIFQAMSTTPQSRVLICVCMAANDGLIPQK